MSPRLPDLSLIMPCYNEEGNLGYSVPRLVRAFERAGYQLQLITVNNGSSDRTSEVLAELAKEHAQVLPVTVDVNNGYGGGVLAGMPYATGTWVDGFIRKIISVGYNTFVFLLFPTLGSWDVNGNPRLWPRWAMVEMELESTNWLLDPEMLIKAHYMGLRVLELNVFARMRGNGLSHVRATTCWEFFVHLLAFRFSGRLSQWRRAHRPRSTAATSLPAA
jgi:hypothetical protein